MHSLAPSRNLIAGSLALLSLSIQHHTQSAELAADIRPILAVGPEAQNNRAAQAAVAALAQSPASRIPELLSAIGEANDLAANYLRSAIDTIVDRTLSSNSTIPARELNAFLANTKNHPRARRLAYEILLRIAPEETARLIPSFANDPSVELRYDAVELLIKTAESLKPSKNKGETIKAFRTALDAARDQKQIDSITTELRALGEEVDLPKHFGFLTHWRIIGPFDNTNLAGFDKPFPPEKELLFDAEYDGKNGKVRWTETATGQDYGKVDLNKPLGELKEVTGYATTVFNSPITGPAELRLGCKNGWKLWLNGKLLFSRDEYHRGARIDQYRMPVTLNKGPNTLLIKLCQNADVKDWTKEWEFQLRVCDSTGTAILATDRPPKPSEPKASPKKK
jgi:hypothetical protein